VRYEKKFVLLKRHVADCVSLCANNTDKCAPSKDIGTNLSADVNADVSTDRYANYEQPARIDYPDA
jgi:hypothetical protein